MSLVSQISNFAAAVGTDIKLIWTLLNGKAANLSALTTTDKSNIVAAINEVRTLASNNSGGSTIDDATTSASKVWSSSKTSTEVSGAATAGANSAVSTVRGGVASTYDTLAKVATKFGTQDTAISNRIRFDAAQTLTAAQRTQVETNLNLGNTETDFAAAYVAARDAA